MSTNNVQPPASMDPSRAWTTYNRDGNEADRLRRAQRRECAALPAPAPTATELARKWTVESSSHIPIPLVQKLLDLEAENLLLRADVESFVAALAQHASAIASQQEAIAALQAVAALKSK